MKIDRINFNDFNDIKIFKACPYNEHKSEVIKCRTMSLKLNKNKEEINSDTSDEYKNDMNIRNRGISEDISVLSVKSIPIKEIIKYKTRVSKSKEDFNESINNLVRNTDECFGNMEFIMNFDVDNQSDQLHEKKENMKKGKIRRSKISLHRQ
jgi:hypothetical protein